MRLWTLHPRYLDPQGLVALWREALLAQAVLQGKTKGYRHHPQLLRFMAEHATVGCIAEYLRVVGAESTRRGYQFSSVKISPQRWTGRILATRGQLEYEWSHLLAKLATRNAAWRETIAGIKRPRSHPLFRIVPGPVAEWERIG